MHSFKELQKTGVSEADHAIIQSIICELETLTAKREQDFLTKKTKMYKKKLASLQSKSDKAWFEAVEAFKVYAKDHGWEVTEK